MARPIKPKEVEKRIKANKAVMRECKKVVMTNMNNALKGEEFLPHGARTALSRFLKAAMAVERDMKKLTLVTEEDK
jgi:hypothetical protein